MTTNQRKRLTDSCSAILKFLQVSENGLKCSILSGPDEKFSDQICKNTGIMAYLDPSSSRAVMWKEILSGVIASKDTCVNDYRSVKEMNDIIEKAKKDVGENKDDDLLFSKNNSVDTTVLKQLDEFIGARVDDDNILAKIGELAVQLKWVLEFSNKKRTLMEDTLEVYEKLKSGVSDVESLPNKVIRKDITCDEAMKKVRSNDEVAEDLMEKYNEFVECIPNDGLMPAFISIFPDGLSDVEPTISKMLEWKKNGKILAYTTCHSDSKECSEITAIKSLVTKNQKMYKELFPYREIPPPVINTPIPAVTEPVVPYADPEDRRRSRRDSGSSYVDRETEKMKNKIRRFNQNVRDLKYRIDKNEPIEDLSEAIIENFKYEVIDLEKKLNNILDLCDEEQEVEVQKIRINEHEYRAESVFREWKTSLEEILQEKKTELKEELYARKVKEDYAKSILNNPNCIVKLEKEADFLDFLESVKQVTGELSDITSDLMIANSIKKALIREKDKVEVKSLTTTKEILEVLTRNYAANKSLIAKIIQPISTLPDPVSYSKSLENCKAIIAFMRRMEEHELTDHLQEVHIANFESRAFHGGRKLTYCAELAKYIATASDEEDLVEGRISPPMGSSTPTVDRSASMGIVRKKKAGSRLNSSVVGVVNLKDKMKSSLSKLAIGKKLVYFTNYIKNTEILFLNEIIASLELTKSSGGPFQRNSRSLNIYKTEAKSGDSEGGPTSYRAKLEERMNDPQFQKPCPTGCGKKHYMGSAKFCEAYGKLPLDQRVETAKKKKLCGNCLQGCGKNGHKGPRECTTKTRCNKCGARNQHNSLLCNKIPDLQAFQTAVDDDKPIEDYSEELEAYYSQLGAEPVIDETIVNYLQEGEDYSEFDEQTAGSEGMEVNKVESTQEEYEEIEILATSLEENNSHLIDVEEIDAEEASFQFFLANEFGEGINQDDCSDYFLHQQAKIAANQIGVKWSKMIPVIRGRIMMKAKTDLVTCRHIISECRSAGVKRYELQSKKFTPENLEKLILEELAPIATDLSLEYIKAIKLKPMKISELGRTMDLHATAAKKRTKEEWEQVMTSRGDLGEREKLVKESNLIYEDMSDNTTEVEVNKTSKQSNHRIPIDEWEESTQSGDPEGTEEIIIFKVSNEHGGEKEIVVRCADLGIKEEDCRLDKMPSIERKTFPPPNENPENYVFINQEAKGVFRLVYDKLIKEALMIYKEHGLITKGVYLPVLVKIKGVKKNQDDVQIIRIKESMYARIILCIDSGSETALLDENIANSFIFDSDSAAPVNVRINTVAGSSSEKMGRQVLLFRGIDGVHYPSCALEIGKIGTDKLQPEGTIEKLCNIFQLNKATRHHFTKNAGAKPRRCHALISMKELGSFYSVIEPEQLGGVSPCISPNTKIIRSILSDQLVIAGQPGINYICSKYQSLFVHKESLARELESIAMESVTISTGITRKRVSDNQTTADPCELNLWTCNYAQVTDEIMVGEFEEEEVMEINKIAIEDSDKVEFDCLLSQEDDAGIGAILDRERSNEMPALTGIECEVLTTIKNKLKTDKMDESKLEEMFKNVDLNSMMIENDHVVHISSSKEMEEDIEENQCCNTSISNLEKLIQAENELNLKILCDTCRLRDCSACNLANSHLTMGEKLKYLKCWKETKLVEHDGQLRCQVDFLYNSDPKETFKKENSNFEEAKRNIVTNINKMKKKGNLSELSTDIQTKIKLGTLTPMSEKEYLWVVENLPHHFSKLHIVHNETSDSTPRRIINNTNSSVPNEATSLSATQLCIANPLMPDFDILVGLLLNEHALSLDVSKAYLRILVPYETSVLRLFIWYDDPVNLKGMKIFRRTTGDFGDTPMSGSLTLTQRKLLAPACKSSIAANIAKKSNFADNYLDSLMSKEGWNVVTRDLIETSELIGLPLKPGATAVHTDKDVIKKNEGQENSNIFGVTWNMKRDDVKPNNYFSLKGKSCGATIGKKLSEMKETEIVLSLITREVLTRMAMQPYDRLNRYISPIIATMKLLLSRASEIVPIHQNKKPVEEYDKEFAEMVEKYLKNLLNFDQINTFPRCVVPFGNILYGFAFLCDGGNPGYAAYTYALSEVSKLVPSIRWDWRLNHDQYGVLSVDKSDLKILDSPAGLSFFTDQQPEKHDLYKKTFQKSMGKKDITNEVLNKRNEERTTFEKTNGIEQMSKQDEMKISKFQENTNDELASHILASKSKGGKRNIPAHEILSRVAASEQAIAISRSISKYSLYLLCTLELVFPGDSVCSALLYSPHLEIRNTLLLGAVRKSEANYKLLSEQLPRANIRLTWIPGVCNSSDFSSKLVIDPIPVINSKLYRNGPPQLHSKRGLKAFCYKEYTPSNGWSWIGLPESLTKVNANAIKLKELLNIKAEDPLRSQRTKDFITAADKEALECNVCNLENLNDSQLKCLDCHTTNADSDNCAILMVTRSLVKKDLVSKLCPNEVKQAMETDKKNLVELQKEKGIAPNTKLVERTSKIDNSKTLIVKKQKSVSKNKKKDNCTILGKQHAVTHMRSDNSVKSGIPNTESNNKPTNGKHSKNINKLEDEVLEKFAAEKKETMIPLDYEYILNSPIIPKDIYFDLLNRVMDFDVTFFKILIYISAMIKLLLTKPINKGRTINYPAETWRSIIMTSQSIFPPRKLKKLSVTLQNGMIMFNPRLSNADHLKLYENPSLPVISGNDWLAPKLVRAAHLSPLKFGNCHRNMKSTAATTMVGKYGVIITEMNKLVSSIIYNCLDCNKYRERKTLVHMGNICTRISSNPRPFQRISVDPLGHIPIKPWPQARNEILGYPLLIKCMETSAIEVYLMFKNDTDRVIMKLLELEARYSTRIIHLTTDHGSNLITTNLNPALRNDHTQHLFGMLKSEHTALPQAQHQNIAESGVKIFKGYFKKIFSLTKDGKVTALVPDEWSYVFRMVCSEINNIPFILDEAYNMLCPNDLVHFSPMIITNNFETSSHFKNVQEFMSQVKVHFHTLQQEMVNISRLEFHRMKQMDHNSKSGYTCNLEPSCLVGWRNSDEKFNSGVILNINGRTAVIKDKLGHRHEIFLGKLTPLATNSFEAFKNKATVLRNL